MLRRLSAAVRVAAVFTSILIFLAHMGAIWVVVRSRWTRVRLSNRLLSRYSLFGLWLLRVKVRPLGVEHLRTSGGGLMVGNHLSYLDVLVISSQVPACFVTSHEIRETPFLGQICQMAGCLFVERRTRANLRGEVLEISDGLKNGLNVAIFPEATSTNGEQILRFRRPLYLAAVEAGSSVQPFCLNYRRVGGQPINSVNRDSVMWYGDMPFAPHLWAMAVSGGIEVDLHFLPALPTTEKSEPAELAQTSQACVESVFRPVENARPLSKL